MNEPRVVTDPPPSVVRSDGTIAGGWWHETEDGRMICDLCPRACNLKPGDRGFCFVRQNRDGEMALTTYGKSTGFCIDPIEKKPLNHFFPGTSVLSFGTAGCNLGCKFCQNHDISKAREVELLSEHATPETIANAAVKLGCQSVAYTYNDPIIWAEYAIDTARACRAEGIMSVAVTAGYIAAQAREAFFEFFDAANVDLKAFTEDFYQKVTLSHLQPILDTLVWLKQETDVWFEITNLIIPNANDSADELQKLCDWVLQNVGDEIPIHFSAFHPDFRMLDRDRTPHETLLKAHEIASSCGLKYVYVGNVHDAQHQSTYCGSCGKLLIERDWYALGDYHLSGDRCGHCGSSIPGRFGSQPGTWGRKRQPIRIGEFRVKPHTGSATDRSDVRQVKDSRTLPQFTARQDDSILAAAGEFVAAAVSGREPNLDDTTLAGMSGQTVDGVYVSLKRQGQLRGCCGFTGKSTSLIDGIKFSAARTACEDPRLPPVSPSELEYLELEVWLLGEQQLVHSRGANRIDEIKVGRDGLWIQQGDARGLLLPGVATENQWDEETFLRQVCVKARLPPTAWREANTVLQRFEGVSIQGRIAPQVLKRVEAKTTVVNEDSFDLYVAFARQNIQLLANGALPNYYLHGAEDGMVNGIVLSARLPNGAHLSASKVSLRPPMPLQTTLYALCEEMVRSVKAHGIDPASLHLDLAILEDPAMHGRTNAPDLRGVSSKRCLFAVGPGQTFAWRFDPTLEPTDNFDAVLRALELRDDQMASLFSFATHASDRINVVKRVQPSAGPDVRAPAVAGKFYPATPKALAAMVKKMLPDRSTSKRSWRAAMIPHAGLQYSGRIAAEVLSQIEFPQRVIVIGPKHTRHGVDWAVAPHQTWTAPGIEISNDRELARLLVDQIEHLQFDAAAHHAEHAIEVELPFLHHFAPTASLVGIAVGGGDLKACHSFATGLARTLNQLSDPVLVLVSSDMNHFASDAETRRLDEMALQALESLDPQQVFHTVRDNDISMCGLLPAVITLDALNQVRPIRNAVRVNYATSGDVTGDKRRVVGYAGMLFE